MFAVEERAEGPRGSFQISEGLSGVREKELVCVALGRGGRVTACGLRREHVEGQAVCVTRTVFPTAQLSRGGTGLSWKGTWLRVMWSGLGVGWGGVGCCEPRRHPSPAVGLVRISEAL